MVSMCIPRRHSTALCDAAKSEMDSAAITPSEGARFARKLFGKSLFAGRASLTPGKRSPRHLHVSNDAESPMRSSTPEWYRYVVQAEVDGLRSPGWSATTPLAGVRDVWQDLSCS